ncbi:MAG: F0F1 ATP synthase subunit A [Candidatus Omnitrophica bacterium]|nr:F0F1 ATP synthase subunit A [Candidatus Omnitrophota bacterium]
MNESPHSFQLDQYILRHVMDSHEWHLPFLPPVQLPTFLSLHSLMVILCAVILLVLFCVFYRKNDRVPTGITNLLEVFVQFVRDEIAIPSLGEEDGQKLTPLFCTFFFFILGLNLMGQIPIFSTATANIGVTAPLALITFFLMTFGAIQKNGFGGFLKAFMPAGVPKLIMPFIFFLELLGVFIKTFALMVRLFANMLAGHMVVLALLGLVVLFGAWALPAIVLAVGISLLEILVVFLQAYIFVLLSAVFIGQMYHPEH